MLKKIVTVLVALVAISGLTALAKQVVTHVKES
jgi:hypothetical protein